MQLEHHCCVKTLHVCRYNPWMTTDLKCGSVVRLFAVEVAFPTFPSVSYTLLPACTVQVHTHNTRSMGKHVTHTHMHTHSSSSSPWILTYWAQTSGIYTLQIWRVEEDTHNLTHKQDQTQSRQMARGQIQRGPLRDARELRWQQRWGNRVEGGEEEEL